jgi:hypothetical protein
MIFLVAAVALTGITIVSLIVRDRIISQDQVAGGLAELR